jgi:hypothetical protein
MKLLIVEDETRIADLLRKDLTKEGLEWSGMYSSSAMPTKPRQRQRVRQAIPRSAPMPSKYPTSSARK